LIAYAETVISPKEIALFRKIEEAVSRLPEIDLGKDEDGEEIILSCHILTRAVSRVFSLKYRDGIWHQYYDHSWLVTKHGHIIDVYPVAVIGGPIMVDRRVTDRLYRIKRIGRGVKRSSFRRAVSLVAQELRKPPKV